MDESETPDLLDLAAFVAGVLHLAPAILASGPLEGDDATLALRLCIELPRLRAATRDTTKEAERTFEIVSNFWLAVIRPNGSLRSSAQIAAVTFALEAP